MISKDMERLQFWRWLRLLMICSSFCCSAFNTAAGIIAGTTGVPSSSWSGLSARSLIPRYQDGITVVLQVQVRTPSGKIGSTFANQFDIPRPLRVSIVEVNHLLAV